MKHIYASCLLLVTALASCHHDVENLAPDLTGTYVARNIITAAHPIALYTKNGLENNPAVVTRFLARRPSLASYFSVSDVPLPSGSTLRLTFRANNRATVLATTPTYTDSIRAEVGGRQATFFLLQNLDSTLSYSPSSYMGCNRISLLADYVRGTAPGKRCFAAPTIGNLNGQACRERPVRVIGVRGGQLYIPFYSWLIQTGGCYTALSGEWNTFGEGVVGQLATGDTLVVQEREIALHR